MDVARERDRTGSGLAGAAAAVAGGAHPEAEAVELLGVRKASSGFSADTTMVDVAVTRGGIANEERYVLRTESPDPPVYPVQVPGWQVEIELQYRIMDALGRALRRAGGTDDRLRGRPCGARRAVLRDGLHRRSGAGRGSAVHDRRVLPRPRARRPHRDDRAGAGHGGARARGRLARRRARLPRARRASRRDSTCSSTLWERVLPDRAARPGAPARRPRVRVAARRAAALQRRRAVLGRSAPGQHHLARRRRRCA